MSWNTSAVLIKSKVGEQPERLFEALGFPNAKFVRSVSFDEAASSGLPGRALAVSKDWTAIFDPQAFGLFADAPIADGFLPALLEQRLTALSRQAEVFSFMLAGRSSTAAFTHFIGGKRVRCLLMQEGTPAIDIGTPSEIETAVMSEDPDMEDAMFSIAERLGFDLFAEPHPQYSLASLSWDRRTDVVSSGGRDYRRSKGDVFVFTQDASGRIVCRQLPILGPTADCPAAVKHIRRYLAEDKFVASLLAEFETR